MRSKLMLFVLVMCVGATAKEIKSYQKAEIQEMTAVECGWEQKSGKGFVGSLVGTDSENRKTRETLCQEYILVSERVIYRVRPKEEKKPVLLPVGEVAEFRIKNEKLLLRVDADDKEREYVVVSMKQRSRVEPEMTAQK